VTVIVPTLRGGPSLERTIACLRAQSYREFLLVVVDNSGAGVARDLHAPPDVVVIDNEANVGFGHAVNQGIAESSTEFVAALNDDAYADPDWLRELISTADADPETVGMYACQIRLSDDPSRLDSAGLDIYPDGTTKQRGNGERAEKFGEPGEVLLPSGCAALYRREMIDQVGAFDGSYFLYCEDTDLGLRGRLAGFRCHYVPTAMVEHDYSRSSGRASAMKAFYVERNRLFTVAKTFPLVLWPLVPAYSICRYLAHGVAAAQGRGLAGDIRNDQGFARLVGIVLSAHWHAMLAFPQLWRARRELRARTTLGTWSFIRLLKRHSVSAWKIAKQ
jgi:GT2 family glycosyltransferase